MLEDSDSGDCDDDIDDGNALPLLFRVPVSELRPFVLPQQDLRAPQPRRDVFGCVLCHQYLKDPVGCGDCAGRFCRGCAEQLLPSSPSSSLPYSDRENQVSDGSLFRECPVCHSLFTLPKADPILAWSMCTLNLPCRYAACHAVLPPAQIVQHESTCALVRVQCRFHGYGCTWTGTLGDYLEQHKGAGGCPLAKVEHGLEQFRLVLQQCEAEVVVKEEAAMTKEGCLRVIRELLSLRDSVRVHQAKRALLMPSASVGSSGKSFETTSSPRDNNASLIQAVKRFKDESTSLQMQEKFLMKAIHSLQQEGPRRASPNTLGGRVLTTRSNRIESSP